MMVTTSRSNLEKLLILYKFYFCYIEAYDPIQQSKFMLREYYNKMISECELCKEKDKKLEALNIDLEFQSRRLKEDLATLKFTLEDVHNREIRKLNQKIANERREREEDNRKWMAKYDEMSKNTQDKITVVETQVQVKVALAVAEREQKFKQENLILEKRLVQQIDQMRRQKTQALRRVENRNEEERKRLLRNQKDDIARMTEEYLSGFQREREQFKAKIADLERELRIYKDQEEGSQRVKMELKNEIAQKKSEQKVLKGRVKELQKNLSEFRMKMTRMKEDISQMDRRAKSQKIQLQRGMLHEKEKAIAQVKAQIESLLRKQLQTCQQFQQQIIDMENQKSAEMDLLTSKLKEAYETFEKRKSRPEDLQQIKYLKERIIAKERENRGLSEELKWYRLQMENKEDTYSRFFNHATINDFANRKKAFKVKRISGPCCAPFTTQTIRERESHKVNASCAEFSPAHFELTDKPAKQRPKIL